MEEIELDLNEEYELPSIDCNILNARSNHLSLKYYSNNSFSILNYNIRSMRKNFSVFCSFLSQLILKFTVMIITETWLSSNIDYGFMIEGYSELNSYRNNQGGCIKVYYDKDLNVDIVNDRCVQKCFL